MTLLGMENARWAHWGLNEVICEESLLGKFSKVSAGNSSEPTNDNPEMHRIKKEKEKIF